MRTYIRPTRIALLLAASIVASAARAQVALNLTAGWNLLGNSSASPIAVATLFGDPAKFTSVWKWNPAAGRWAFYAPSLDSSALATYAQGKGYDVLSSIAPKEGFWVNAATTAALSGPAASGVTLDASDLQQGWNLAGSADNKTPSQLNQALSSSLSAAGKLIVTTWAWDAAKTNWKFYAPSLEAQGGAALANYIVSRGYLEFSSALSAAEGFWMNIGAASSTTSTTATTTTTTTTVPTTTTTKPTTTTTAATTTTTAATTTTTAATTTTTAATTTTTQPTTTTTSTTTTTTLSSAGSATNLTASPGSSAGGRPD